MAASKQPYVLQVFDHSSITVDSSYAVLEYVLSQQVETGCVGVYYTSA